MYTSLEDIIAQCKKTSLPFWKVVQLEDCQESDITEEASFEKMKSIYQAMKESDENYDATLRSASGMVGNCGSIKRITGCSAVGFRPRSW